MMKVIKAGHAYELEDGNLTKLVFRHRDERLGVLVDGVTTCDLLEVLIHRISSLNQGDGYGVENVETLLHLHGALDAQKRRFERVNTALNGASQEGENNEQG
jgi:hypothetical protein